MVHLFISQCILHPRGLSQSQHIPAVMVLSDVGGLPGGCLQGTPKHRLPEGFPNLSAPKKNPVYGACE